MAPTYLAGDCQLSSKALSTLETIVAEFGDCRQKRRRRNRRL